MANKILIITGNEINHNYFINSLKSSLSEYQIDTVKFHSGIDNYEYYYNVYSKNIKNEEEHKFLVNFIFNRNKTFAIKEKYDFLKNTVSSEYIFNNKIKFNQCLDSLIRENNYSAVFCYGSPIIDNKHLLKMSTAFNIHMGLSKYYKGGTANILALSNGHFDKVGLTCHQLREELDGGNILFEIDSLDYSVIDNLDSLTHYLLKSAIWRIVTLVKQDDFSVNEALQGKLLLNKNILVSDIISAEQHIKEYKNGK